MIHPVRLIRWKTRKATCSARALPDFLIIGAPRCGTTSLYHYLVQHPDVLPSFRKEVHFFSRSEIFARGICHYRAHFPLERRMKLGRLTGEATPSYLLRPHVPERVAEHLPDSKFIVLLRDPVERAISSWNHFHHNGAETRSLDVAIHEELQRLGPDSAARPRPPGESREGMNDFDHVHYGRYAEHLERWFAVFPRDRFHVIISESLFHDPRGVYTGTLDFLGLPQTAYPEFRTYNELTTPESEEVRSVLREYYRLPNERLREMMGLDTAWQ